MGVGMVVAATGVVVAGTITKSCHEKEELTSLVG
jgi:hypothetical protein